MLWNIDNMFNPLEKLLLYIIVCYENETRIILLGGLFIPLMDFTPSESLISPTGNKPLVTPMLPH